MEQQETNSKTIDKITFTLFIYNILGIIAMPMLMYFFGSGKISFETFQILHAIITIPIIVFWVYNIRFLWKYNRYSGEIIPLICLNALYAPFYYYRVKIKKRPLKNKIKKRESVLDKIIEEEEI